MRKKEITLYSIDDLRELFDSIATIDDMVNLIEEKSSYKIYFCEEGEFDNGQ